MTILRYIFGTKHCILSKTLGPYAYQSYNINHINYKLIKAHKEWRLRKICHTETQNSVSQYSCEMKIGTHPRVNVTPYRLTIDQGHLTKNDERNIGEGRLGIMRFGKFCPKYLPRSVSVFVTSRKFSTFNCTTNIRVIISDFNTKEAIHAINLHCLDTARVISHACI